MWTYNDGGRSAAGYKGTARDCAVRAIAIATGTDYRTVYKALHRLATEMNVPKPSPRTGVSRAVSARYLKELGWHWTPTMGIGTGCRVHLRPDELPGGPLVARVTRHVCAVIDGVVHDTHDPTRDGTRCVYGLWTPTPAPSFLTPGLVGR